jgi:hypothetical protein
METEKKFSEMLHGDTAWMRYQSMVNRETYQRAVRSGKSVLMLDTEHGGLQIEVDSLSFVDQRHYDARDYLVKALYGEMGFGKGMQAKREMATRVEVQRKIDAGSPALAAEQRCTERGSDLMAVALMELRERNEKALRLWNKVNWYHNYMEGRYNR